MGRLFNKIRIGYRILKAAKPLLLSHHPNCVKFKNHTATIKGHRLCLGCFIIYPTLIISFIILKLINDTYFTFLDWHFIPLGFMLVLLIFNNSENKPIIIVNNIFVGLGSAILWLSIFSLPFGFFYNLLIFIVFLLMIGLITGYIMDKQLRVCSESCPYRRQWHLCPGLKDVYKDISDAQK